MIIYLVLSLTNRNEVLARGRTVWVNTSTVIPVGLSYLVNDIHYLNVYKSELTQAKIYLTFGKIYYSVFSVQKFLLIIYYAFH